MSIFLSGNWVKVYSMWCLFGFLYAVIHFCSFSDPAKKKKKKSRKGRQEINNSLKDPLIKFHLKDLIIFC